MPKCARAKFAITFGFKPKDKCYCGTTVYKHGVLFYFTPKPKCDKFHMYPIAPQRRRHLPVHCADTQTIYGFRTSPSHKLNRLVNVIGEFINEKFVVKRQRF